MKAGIYLGKEHVELWELPLPEVGDKDVLVQNLYSSVCGTDVAVLPTVRTRATRSLSAGNLDTKLYLAW